MGAHPIVTGFAVATGVLVALALGVLLVMAYQHGRRQ
jgi:hypothetical protein